MFVCAHCVAAAAWTCWGGEQDYVAQAKTMAEGESTTMYVDFTHVQSFDNHLAEAVSSEYYRFEPFVRQAIQAFMRELEPGFAISDTDLREFFVAFYNLSTKYKCVPPFPPCAAPAAAL